MEKRHTDYYVYPSVIRVGETAKVNIVPRNIAKRFDNPYAEKNWPPEDLAPHLKETVRKVRIVPYDHFFYPSDDSSCGETEFKTNEDGSLTVEFTPDREQEYMIKVKDYNDDSWKHVFYVYAVNDDLYGKRAYKGDLHSHSVYSDGSEHYTEVAANYRSSGFDFMALTDHFKRFPSLLMQKEVNSHDFGLTVYPGEEVHVPDFRFHYVNVGSESSVNEYYENHKDEYDQEYRAIYDSLEIKDENVREFVAKIKWIHEAIKKSGGVSIYAHPYWRWNTYNMPSEVSDYVFEYGLMDAFELMGGMYPYENNLQLALWQEWAIKGKKYPIVGSSDQHTTYKDRGALYNAYFSIVFAKDPSFETVINAIMNGDNVAVEHRLQERVDFRAYGSQRYVMYSHFLWREYFPQYEYFCNTVGMLMKMYFEGDEAALASALEAQKRADTFAERFFGRM